MVPRVARTVLYVCVAAAGLAGGSGAFALDASPVASPTPTFTPLPASSPTFTPLAPTGAQPFVVGSTGNGGDANPGDGFCDDGTGACTLRAAAEETLALSAPPCVEWFEHTIDLAVSGVITLEQPVYLAAGACGRTVRVNGPGSDALTVLGGGLVVGGSGAAGSETSVRGLTVRTAGIGIHHQATNLGFPSAVELVDVVLTDNDVGIGFGFRAMLTVADATIDGNRGPGLGRARDDGAQANDLTVRDSRIRDNGGAGIDAYALRVAVERASITGNGGAGVAAPGGVVMPEVTIIDSTIADNGGSGVTADGGLRVAGSTLSGNGDGGAVVTAGAAQFVNSTISGNRTAGDGGGIRFAGGGTLALHNVTIAANRADDDGDGSGDGGGVHLAAGSATVANTILAGNTDAGGEAPDCAGTLAACSYSLIEDAAGCTATGTGNLLGTAAGLGLLAGNGGTTLTHMPDVTSPVRDAGDPAGCRDGDGALLASDQRGSARPQGAACDIGAVELAPAACTPAACDDGDPCTTDSCAASGCVHAATPASGCALAASSALVIRQGSDDAQDAFVWKWTRGAAVDWAADLAGAHAAVCIYAGNAGTPIARALLPESGWTAVARGLRFKGNGPDGLTAAIFKEGRAGRSRFVVRGDGAALPDPSLPASLPLVIQLRRNDSPRCLESRFDAPRDNGTTRFRARLPMRGS